MSTYAGPAFCGRSGRQKIRSSVIGVAVSLPGQTSGQRTRSAIQRVSRDRNRPPLVVEVQPARWANRHARTTSCTHVLIENRSLQVDERHDLPVIGLKALRPMVARTIPCDVTCVRLRPHRPPKPSVRNIGRIRSGDKECVGVGNRSICSSNWWERRARPWTDSRHRERHGLGKFDTKSVTTGNLGTRASR